MAAAPERGQANGFLGPLRDGRLGHGILINGWDLRAYTER